MVTATNAKKEIVKVLESFKKDSNPNRRMVVLDIDNTKGLASWHSNFDSGEELITALERALTAMKSFAKTRGN